MMFFILCELKLRLRKYCSMMLIVFAQENFLYICHNLKLSHGMPKNYIMITMWCAKSFIFLYKYMPNCANKTLFGRFVTNFMHFVTESCGK